MRLALLVGAGSFAGGICRYLLSLLVQSRAGISFPYGTMTVNLIGCLLIGCLYGISERWAVSGEVKLLLITGVLGGFTTFSAFSAESFTMIKEGRFLASLIYVFVSVLGGVALTALGAWIFKLSLR